MSNIKNITELSIGELKQWNSLTNNILKERKRTKEKATENYSYENASYYIRKNQYESYRFDGNYHQ